MLRRHVTAVYSYCERLCADGRVALHNGCRDHHQAE